MNKKNYYETSVRKSTSHTNVSNGNSITIMKLNCRCFIISVIKICKENINVKYVQTKRNNRNKYKHKHNMKHITQPIIILYIQNTFIMHFYITHLQCSCLLKSSLKCTSISIIYINQYLAYLETGKYCIVNCITLRNSKSQPTCIHDHRITICVQ